MMGVYSEEDPIKEQVRDSIGGMLGWLKAVSFNNGQTPRVNDSTNGMAPSPLKLYEYAHRLGLKSDGIILGESGYRMIKSLIISYSSTLAI